MRICMFRKFIYKILIFVLPVVLIGGIIVFNLSIDNNYLYEYKKKIELLEMTPQPRIIFIGGSNLAFGIDSRTIQDSLNFNVVNFGLHGGFGIKFPFEHYMHYAQKGDKVVLQFEYENFYSGGNGEQALLELMICTNWEYVDVLNINQALILINQIPLEVHHYILSFFYREKQSHVTESPIYLIENSEFNEFGDEIAHFHYTSGECDIQQIENKEDKRKINQKFIKWLDKIINRCEQKGVDVIMLPPVCVQSHYNNVYSNDISMILQKTRHPYIVEPSYMMLDDSCYFNSGYHVNRSGVIQNTEHIIKVLREHL